MIINDNIAALNTFNALNKNTSAMNQALAELSSGKQINSAADNPSGLTISEQMQGQINGLNQADSNTQDGISLIQTAMGGLTETSNILQSMRELAVQAANGTNTTQDFQAIQDQINQYTSEISAIGNTTQFNTMNLLNGGSVASTTTAVSSNGLTVAPNLTGGQGVSGGAKPAGTEVTFGAVDASASGQDGENFSLNIGGQNLTVTYDSKATASSLSGNAITIATSNGEAASSVATDVASQINNFISNNATLKNNYGAIAVGGDLFVGAATVALNASGVLTGPLNGGTVTSATGATKPLSGAGFVNTAASGTYANGSINFSGATVAKLAGTGINIGGQSIAFYDSANGKYTGNADFAIDLNGDQTAGQIVSTIVSDMAGTADGKVAAATTSGVTYGANDSALANVWLSASSNGNALELTAAKSGAAGNAITMGNVAPVTVTQTNGNTKLTGEQVDSAMGLADGEQKVTITNVAAATTFEVATGSGLLADLKSTEGGSGNDVITIGITSGSNMTAGIYALVGTGTVNHFELEEQNASGSFSAVTGANGNVLSGTLAVGANSVTIGDLTVNTTAYTSGAFAGGASGASNTFNFNVDPNHYDATMTEAGSTSGGTAVQVSNGQTNVTLVAANGIGSAVVNIGSFDPNDFNPGDTIKWSFNTQQAPSSTQAGNGTFSTKLQIGANQGQMMSISIGDARAAALGIAGTASGTAAGAAGGASGAYFTSGSGNNALSDYTKAGEGALNVTSQSMATAAITVLDQAISAVSTQNSQLGAYQDRLQDTSDNLNTGAQNLTSANAQLVDVDMASEMSTYTQDSILVQAATSMLAQAQQEPQNVLKLLQSI